VRVIDTRANLEGTEIRRRRRCTGCSMRFTTYEVIGRLDGDLYATQRGRAKAIAGELRDMARSLEVW
jgi:transcriptional regulator NrdR family protein